MATARVRCVCGTVFDPGAGPVCPACGSPHDAASPGPPSDGPLPDGPGAAVAGVARPARYKVWALAAGGVGVLLAAALAVHALSDNGGSADRPAEAQAKRPADPGGGQADGSSPTPPAAAAASGAATPAPADASAAPKFEGTWRLLVARMQPEPIIPGLPTVPTILNKTVTAAFMGPDASATLTIDQYGAYELDIDVAGEGQYAATMKPNRSDYVAASGVISFTPKGSPVADRTSASLRPVKQDRPHQNLKAGDTELSMLPAGSTGGATAVWARPGGGGDPDDLVGAWTSGVVYIDSYLPYSVTLELKDNGDYRIRFTRTERGVLEASDGKYEFKRAVAMGPPVQGRYQFDGPDRVTFIEPRGTATWVRQKQP